MSLSSIPAEFPDDGTFARQARWLDHKLGLVEQGVLVVLLAAVVLTAASAAVSDKLLHDPLGRWWFTVVRGGTFAIAMFGAVFATHQQRHLAMDLVSRRLPPRGRLVLGAVLKLFTMAIAALLVHSGFHQTETVGGAGDSFISDKTVVTAMPVAGIMIMLHSAIHLAIDIDYFMRGKLPPERARSGH